MNAAGSVGVNSPLRLRLPVMISGIKEASSATPGAPAKKSGSAIAIGSIARRRDVDNAAIPAAAPMRRTRGASEKRPRQQAGQGDDRCRKVIGADGALIERRRQSGDGRAAP